MEMNGQLHALAALPSGRAPGTHWIGGWVGPRVSLDAVVKRKFPAPARTQNPYHPTHSPVLYHWAILAPTKSSNNKNSSSTIDLHFGGTGWTTGVQFLAGTGKEFFLYTTASRTALGTTKPPIPWVTGTLSLKGLSGWGVKLTTHLCLVPSLRMWKVIPPFPICLYGMVLS